jgi:hypothetical protein
MQIRLLVLKEFLNAHTNGCLNYFLVVLFVHRTTAHTPVCDKHVISQSPVENFSCKRLIIQLETDLISCALRRVMFSCQGTLQVLFIAVVQETYPDILMNSARL